jgi:hypothetical protein
LLLQRNRRRRIADPVDAIGLTARPQTWDSSTWDSSWTNRVDWPESTTARAPGAPGTGDALRDSQSLFRCVLDLPAPAPAPSGTTLLVSDGRSAARPIERTSDRAIDPSSGSSFGPSSDSQYGNNATATPQQLSRQFQYASFLFAQVPFGLSSRSQARRRTGPGRPRTSSLGGRAATRSVSPRSGACRCCATPTATTSISKARTKTCSRLLSAPVPRAADEQSLLTSHVRSNVQ